MEDFMNELQENANLFEVNIPEYKQLKERFEKYEISWKNQVIEISWEIF